MNGGALNSRGLTAKQSVFVDNFLNIDNPLTFGNGVKSAKFAGYKGNEVTLANVAYQNLRKSQIRREIDRKMKKILSSDEVLQELSDIGSADWRDFVEIRYGKDGLVIDASLKLGDKIRALELTGKYHKLFTDKVESTDTSERDGTESAILKSIERTALKAGITQESAAKQLYLAGKDDAENPLSNPANFPAQFREILSKSVDSEPETISEASQ